MSSMMICELDWRRILEYYILYDKLLPIACQNFMEM